ncbi:MAG: hypothetical protein JWM37_43 [Candidatus Saccharibacteria bacterium]|nr:hypothetical protein [Candidatus Saccharibacteria bacterium]
MDKSAAQIAAPAKRATKPKLSLAELEAQHARAHKRLTMIETAGVVLLVFVLLAALAGWAYYQQETNAASKEPYSTNEYQ